jgi:hypothetical protein
MANKNYIYNVFIIYTLVVTTSTVNANDYDETIDVVTKCAALLNNLARSTSNTQEEYETHTMHVVANGSMVMAYHMADDDGLSREYVDIIYSSHEWYYKTLENLTIKSNDYKAYEGEIKKDIPICIELNKVQAEYIKELKKEMYKKK